MEKTWVILFAISIFLIITFIYWRVTRVHMKKIYGDKWKIWGARTFYWQDAIYISAGVTFLILAILKWTHVLPF